MRIEVLYFEGCPQHQATVQLVHEVIAELGVRADVHEVEVRDQEDATHLRFLGLPSVRVEGVDIEPDAHDDPRIALACRMYQGSDVPPKPPLVAALEGCV